MSQVELQQSIERFAGRFVDDVMLVADASASSDTVQQQDSLRRLLSYATSALDIATGVQPEINLLDMLVFVSLSRQTLEHYWIPKVFRQRGPILNALFADCERQLWAISARMMSGSQQQQLLQLIRSWLAAHPEQVRVDWVRFEDISARCGELAQEHAEIAHGILGCITPAAQTADHALLLAGRALFIANRLPSILRLHARVGVQDMLDDSLARVREAPALPTNAAHMRTVLLELTQLSSTAAEAAREGRLLCGAVEPMLRALNRHGTGSTKWPSLHAASGRAQQLLDACNRLLDRCLRIATGAGPSAQRTIEGAFQGSRWLLDATLRRCIVYLSLLGAVWAICFWGGYYLAKQIDVQSAAEVPSNPSVCPTSVSRPLAR